MYVYLYVCMHLTSAQRTELYRAFNLLKGKIYLHCMPIMFASFYIHTLCANKKNTYYIRMYVIHIDSYILQYVNNVYIKNGWVMYFVHGF